MNLIKLFQLPDRASTVSARSNSFHAKPNYELQQFSSAFPKAELQPEDVLKPPSEYSEYANRLH